jgi:hypothetical protein
MTANKRYQQIQEETPKDLDKRILVNLQVGEVNRISRIDLIIKVFGHHPGPNWRNSNEDRQIRITISKLQETYTILSDSGEGGYWLGTDEEKEKYIGELTSRIAKLSVKVHNLSHSCLPGTQQLNLFN